MIYCSIVASVLFAVFGFIRSRSVVSPSVMFPLLWTCILLIHSFQLYGIGIVDNNVLYIVIFGELFFGVGNCIASVSKYRLTLGSVQSCSKELNVTVIKWLSLLFFLLMMLPVSKAIMSLLSGNSLYSIRYVLLRDILGEGFISILFNYFCEPFLICLIVISVVDIMSSKKHVWITIISVLGILLMVLVTGGRFFILYYIGSLALCYYVFRKSKKERNVVSKQLKWAKALLALAIISIIFVSMVRGSLIGQTIFVYSSGGLSFLSRLVEKFNNTEYTYGALTMNGLLRPVFVVIRKIGISELPEFLQKAESIFLYADKPFYIADGILFNSFTTCFFAPYIDGGLVGVAVVFFALGYICEKKYMQVMIDNKYSISIYLLWGLVILLSFFRLLVTHYSFALAFVYILPLFQRNRKKIDPL